MSDRPSAPPTGLIGRIARVLLVRQNMRRGVMFYLLVVALALVLVGGILFPGWLRARPWVFLWWWASCSAVTLLAMFLAIADLLILRVTERANRRMLVTRIEKEVTKSEEDANGNG
ncbi:MAG: hypothetical protein JSR82_14945 [Verrucomicrobia bacterium]|nr:hypothetical protein [Verrucomicrobiota bacterium]